MLIPFKSLVKKYGTPKGVLHIGPSHGQEAKDYLGSGVEKFKEICLHENAVFSLNEFPSATEMALQAETKYKKNDIEDVAYFEPYYLKDFVPLKAKS